MDPWVLIVRKWIFFFTKKAPPPSTLAINPHDTASTVWCTGGQVGKRAGVDASWLLVTSQSWPLTKVTDCTNGQRHRARQNLKWLFYRRLNRNHRTGVRGLAHVRIVRKSFRILGVGRRLEAGASQLAKPCDVFEYGHPLPLHVCCLSFYCATPRHKNFLHRPSLCSLKIFRCQGIVITRCE